MNGMLHRIMKIQDGQAFWTKNFLISHKVQQAHRVSLRG
jgi:hypothetical protein